MLRMTLTVLLSLYPYARFPCILHIFASTRVNVLSHAYSRVLSLSHSLSLIYAYSVFKHNIPSRVRFPFISFSYLRLGTCLFHYGYYMHTICFMCVVILYLTILFLFQNISENYCWIFLFFFPPLMTHNKTNSSNISSIIISASNNNRQTKQFNTFDHINFQQLLQKCSRNLSALLLLVYPVHSLHIWFEFCHKENERRRQKKISSNKSYAGLSSCVGVSLSSTDAAPTILCWIH